MSAYFKRFPPGFIGKSTLVIFGGGGGLFTLRSTLDGNEKFYRDVLMPLASKCLDPEDAHNLTIRLINRGLVPVSARMKKEYPELTTDVMGKSFKNPLGLAAGFDKNAECAGKLEEMGFGFVEVGTVTPLPQDGNEKPRVFRLPEDEGVINRYGFNSWGHGAVRSNLLLPRPHSVPLGVNVGKNRATSNPELDYSVGVSLLGPLADYVVLNVSSPNTPGLRNLQHGKELKKILTAAANSRKLIASSPPRILVKVAPDMTFEERKSIAAICLDRRYGIDGIIVSNTTIQRPESLHSAEKAEAGGLSGVPLKGLSTEAVRDFYRLTKGKIPIIGCGGISSGADAYEKIKAGASLVQIYTSVIYQGFPVIGRIKRELVECLQKDGFQSISEAVGKDVR